MRKYLFSLIFTMLFCFSGHAQSDTLKSDSLLLIQIQQELHDSNDSSPVITTRIAPSANPDISVIGDFRGSYQSNYERNYNAELHEAEISLQSVIDPYARADFFVSFSHDPGSGEFKADIEEGYLTTLSLPAHLQLKAGKFKQALGRINPLHPHALPFVDMPNAFVQFFGEEGMKDEGMQLSWLIPNHTFYQELTVELTDGPTESPSFSKSKKNNLLKLAHLKNFWDLTSNATLEFGMTGISGVNYTENNSSIAAVDLTYKWKPVKYNTYQSFTFQNEFYYSHATFDSSTINAIGLYSLINTQVSKRWFVTGRYDYTNKPSSESFIEQAGSVIFGWFATEFQKIELQYKTTFANQEVQENNFEKNYHQVFLRWVFVIGTHGAHMY